MKVLTWALSLAYFTGRALSSPMGSFRVIGTGVCSPSPTADHLFRASSGTRTPSALQRVPNMDSSSKSLSGVCLRHHMYLCQAVT